MDKMEENGAEFSQMSDDCCTDRNKQTCENEIIQVQVKVELPDDTDYEEGAVYITERIDHDAVSSPFEQTNINTDQSPCTDLPRDIKEDDDDEQPHFKISNKAPFVFSNRKKNRSDTSNRTSNNNCNKRKLSSDDVTSKKIDEPFDAPEEHGSINVENAESGSFQQLNLLMKNKQVEEQFIGNVKSN